MGGFVGIERRTLLLGGAAGLLGAGGGGYLAVDQGVLPGKARLREALGLTGEDGEVPGVAPVPVMTLTRRSEARGADVTMITMVPDGAKPVVLALHGRGGRAQDFVDLGLPQFLTAAIGAGVPPFAVVAVDGGADSYWHARHPGDDPQAMLLKELPGWLAEAGLAEPAGALGISMGGSGALQYARNRKGVLTAVAVLSPALFPTWDDARTVGAFADSATWKATEPLQHPGAPLSSRLGVWCGKDDPFYEPPRDLADGWRPQQAAFAPGLHTAGYWRRVMPSALAFLGG